MIDADIAFLSAIYQASGNLLIFETTELHWIYLRRVMGAVLQLAGQREAISDEHEAIEKAIAAGDVKQAAELAGTHAYIARENLFAHLGEAVSFSQSKHKARSALRTP